MLACLLCGQLCLSWKPSWFTALRHGLCAPFLQCLGHLSLHGTVNEYQLSNWWLGLTVGGSTFITRTQWTLAMTLWSWWQHYKYLPVMWSETVGLRTRPVWDQKKSVLVLQVLCCVVKHNLVTLVVIMILEDTAAFQVLFLVSLFCAWNITTVINSGVHLLKS